MVCGDIVNAHICSIKCPREQPVVDLDDFKYAHNKYNTETLGLFNLMWVSMVNWVCLFSALFACG